MRPPKLDLEELVRIQERVARRVIREDRFKRLRTIAGCDISFARGGVAHAACAVLDYGELEVLKQRIVRVRLRFPYIPTFLAFRELEGLLRAVEGLKADVYMVGAHGVAHPRRAGLACHLGVVIGKPALGVAKSKLCGEAEPPPMFRGAYTELRDGGEVVGALVRTREGTRPVYVSVGHKLSLNTAVRIAVETTREHRLPEPLFVAHRLATKAMRGNAR